MSSETRLIQSEPVTVPLDELPAHKDRILGPSTPIIVDQAMIGRFAELTGDRQWVHVDVTRARRELGATLAHGYLTLALVPRLFSALLRISGVGHGLNYGTDRVRFPAPLRAGTAVSATLEIMDVTPRNTGQMLRTRISIVPAGETIPVCVTEPLTLLFAGDGILG